MNPSSFPCSKRRARSSSEAVLSNVFVVGSTSLSSSKLKTTPLDALLEERPRDLTADVGGDDDAAVVVYTSGTTGKPKGAVRKFPKDTIQAAMRFINETPMRVDDVHLVTCPLYHSTAFGFLSLSHLLGATAVLMDEFKPEPFLELVERYSVTSTAMVPTMLHRVMELPEEVRNRYDTRSLRIVFAGGAPLPAPLAIDFMDTFGDVVYEFYGATETGLVTLAKPEDLRAAPGTIGKAIPGNDIRLLDDGKRDVPTGEVGELYVKNKLLVAGYHKDEEATRSSMVDGYFSVGDLARRDREGRYFIEGRKRDMVISGGVNVYPAEVEGVLEQHPDIAEVAVVGVPDREWGERVRAFVVPRAGATLDEGALKVFARERLAGPKVPRDFVVIDALPRNPTGKVLKRELRERAVSVPGHREIDRFIPEPTTSEGCGKTTALWCRHSSRAIGARGHRKAEGGTDGFDRAPVAVTPPCRRVGPRLLLARRGWRRPVRLPGAPRDRENRGEGPGARGQGRGVLVSR